MAESPYDRVVRAPERTIALGTARVWEGDFYDEALREPAGISTGEGLADFAGRSTRIEHRATEEERELARRLSERFPEIADEEDDEPTVSLNYGGRSFFGSSAGWMEFHAARQEDPMRPNHPLWLLGVLTAVGPDIDVAGQEMVRATPTIQYRARIDIEAARLVAPGSLPRLTRRTRRYWSALQVAVWLDESGVIRRMGWINVPRVRPRAPWPPKPRPTWKLVEFWDFGVPVEISLPSDVPRTAPQPWWKMALELWRWRRDVRSEGRHQD